MTRDRGQLDLKADVRAALEPYVPEDVPENATAAVLAAVLPHFVLAYKRGLMAAQSRAGYRAAREPKEGT